MMGLVIGAVVAIVLWASFSFIGLLFSLVFNAIKFVVLFFMAYPVVFALCIGFAYGVFMNL